MDADVARKQELYRAREIVKVAERDGLNVAKTLRHYGVPNSIINDLGMEAPVIVPKSKKTSNQQKMEEWAKSHIGQNIKGANQMVEDIGISYATANGFIQARRDLFTRIMKGLYFVKDPVVDRQEV